MIQFTLKHPRATHDMLGLLPEFWDERDPRPAKEQADEAYRHGGGWRPFHGLTMEPAGLSYPGDPPMKLVAEANLRTETIRVYECSWVAIVQPDGSHEICRMD